MVDHITLRDVAQHAGVSITTVSNVVRNWPHVSSSTRHKVESAIRELGYTPHAVAQGLRTGQTRVIAFVVPDLSNPYFAAIVSAAESVAQEHGYTILVFNSHEDAEYEARCIQIAARRWADGLLLASTIQGGHGAFAPVKIPLVAIDRVPEGYTGPFCSLDHLHAGRLATQHLVDLGHRRIAHLGGPALAGSAVARERGYAEVLTQNGIDYRRVTTASSAWGCDDGYLAMQHVLAQPERPTAVFASNDRMAIGALHAIGDNQLRVPDDISLVGVDDIEMSRHMSPPLTTVSQPLVEMARAGIDLLLRIVRGETPQQQQLLLEPGLVIRESTGSAQ
jgi:LacI family transcriptional regulator